MLNNNKVILIRGYYKVYPISIEDGTIGEPMDSPDALTVINDTTVVTRNSGTISKYNLTNDGGLKFKFISKLRTYISTLLAL